MDIKYKYNGMINHLLKRVHLAFGMPIYCYCKIFKIKKLDYINILKRKKKITSTKTLLRIRDVYGVAQEVLRFNYFSYYSISKLYRHNGKSLMDLLCSNRLDKESVVTICRQMTNILKNRQINKSNT